MKTKYMNKIRSDRREIYPSKLCIIPILVDVTPEKLLMKLIFFLMKYNELKIISRFEEKLILCL